MQVAHTDLKYSHVSLNALVINQNQVDIVSFLHIYPKLPSATDRSNINQIFPVISFFKKKSQ